MIESICPFYFATYEIFRYFWTLDMFFKGMMLIFQTGFMAKLQIETDEEVLDQSPKYDKKAVNDEIEPIDETMVDFDEDDHEESSSSRSSEESHENIPVSIENNQYSLNNQFTLSDNKLKSAGKRKSTVIGPVGDVHESILKTDG